MSLESDTYDVSFELVEGLKKKLNSIAAPDAFHQREAFSKEVLELTPWWNKWGRIQTSNMPAFRFGLALGLELGEAVVTYKKLTITADTVNTQPPFEDQGEEENDIDWPKDFLTRFGENSIFRAYLNGLSDFYTDSTAKNSFLRGFYNGSIPFFYAIYEENIEKLLSITTGPGQNPE